MLPGSKGCFNTTKSLIILNSVWDFWMLVIRVFIVATHFSKTCILGSFPSDPHLLLTWALFAHLIQVDLISPYHWTHFIFFLALITSETISVMWHLLAFGLFW